MSIQKHSYVNASTISLPQCRVVFVPLKILLRWNFDSNPQQKYLSFAKNPQIFICIKRSKVPNWYFVHACCCVAWINLRNCLSLLKLRWAEFHFHAFCLDKYWLVFFAKTGLEFYCCIALTFVSVFRCIPAVSIALTFRIWYLQRTVVTCTSWAPVDAARNSSTCTTPTRAPSTSTSQT